MLNPERQSSLVRLHEILASAMNDRSGSTSSSDLSSLVSAPGRQELLQPILSVIQEQRTGTSNSVWQEEQYINGETGKNDEGEGKSTHVLVRKEEKAEGGISRVERGPVPCLPSRVSRVEKTAMNSQLRRGSRSSPRGTPPTPSFSARYIKPLCCVTLFLKTKTPFVFSCPTSHRFVFN